MHENILESDFQREFVNSLSIYQVFNMFKNNGSHFKNTDYYWVPKLTKLKKKPPKMEILLLAFLLSV